MYFSVFFPNVALIEAQGVIQIPEKADNTFFLFQ